MSFLGNVFDDFHPFNSCDSFNCIYARSEKIVILTWIWNLERATITAKCNCTNSEESALFLKDEQMNHTGPERVASEFFPVVLT